MSESILSLISFSSRRDARSRLIWARTPHIAVMGRVSACASRRSYILRQVLNDNNKKSLLTHRLTEHDGRMPGGGYLSMSYAALSVPDVMELKRAAREQPRSGPAPSAAWTRAALASGDETHTPGCGAGRPSPRIVAAVTAEPSPDILVQPSSFTVSARDHRHGAASDSCAIGTSSDRTTRGRSATVSVQDLCSAETVNRIGTSSGFRSS